MAFDKIKIDFPPVYIDADIAFAVNRVNQKKSMIAPPEPSSIRNFTFFPFRQNATTKTKQKCAESLPSSTTSGIWKSFVPRPLRSRSGSRAFPSRSSQFWRRIRHRGPDWSGIRVSKNHILCHERLAIVGIDSGAQPLTNADESVILAVNGEIYNHLALRDMLVEKRRREDRPDPIFKTGSDCEVILHLYEEYGPTLVNYLDGMFAFVLYDKTQDRFIAARDPIGIITLYQGWASDGCVFFV
jgi:hypothetical protein